MSVGALFTGGDSRSVSDPDRVVITPVKLLPCGTESCQKFTEDFCSDCPLNLSVCW